MKKLLVFFLLLFALCELKAQTSVDTAVHFVVTDVDGTTHNLFDYLDSGKIVVIDFFTTTCGPCTEYVPEISSSFSHFGCNSGNVIFLGINWGASNEEVIEFGNLYNAKYPEISGQEGNGNHVVSDYGVLSYPTVILILPDHSIAEQYIWPPSAATLDSLILLYGGHPTDCTVGIPDFQSGQNHFEIVSQPDQAQNAFIRCNHSIHPQYAEIYSSTSAFISGSQISETEKPDVFSIKLTGLPHGLYIIKLFSENSCIGSLKLMH